MSKPKIQGYRELSEEEIDTINDIKFVEGRCGVLIEDLMNNPDADKRAVAIARTKLQEAFMWAARAVAKPDSALNP